MTSACARIGYEVMNDRSPGLDNGGSNGDAIGAGGAAPNGGGNAVGSSPLAGGAHYGGAQAGGVANSRGGSAGTSSAWSANGGTAGASSNGGTLSQGGIVNTSITAAGATAGDSGLGGALAIGGSTAGNSSFAGANFGGSPTGGVESSGTNVTSGFGSAGAGAGGAATGGAVTSSAASASGGAATGGAAFGGAATASGGTATGGATCDWSKGPPAFGKAKSLGEPNSSAWEGDPVLSYDGLTLYFARFNQSSYDIYYATRASTTGSFDAGTSLTAANSSSDEAHFFAGVSGLEAFVVSRRSSTADILRATRASTTADWGTFTAVANLDSSSDEQDPHLDADQLTLWFARKGGIDASALQYDVFYAMRPDAASQFGVPVAATSLNSTADEADVSLTRDGLVILFLSTRDSTRRVYYAVRGTRAQSFGSPLPLTALDSYSGSSLGNPFVAPDGCAVYFAADVPSGKGGADLYVIGATP